jgi:glucose/arabinose dehydrogenase
MLSSALAAARRIAGGIGLVVLAQAAAATAQGDTQPPGVSSQSPAAGATGVAITVNVTAAFTEPVQPASIAFVVRDASNTVVPSTLTYSAATRTVTLDPQADLLPGQAYTATLSAAVDLAGNALAVPVTWSFTTHPGFQDAAALGGLVNPTAFQFAPDGRVFVAEKSGLIKVFDSLTDTTPTIFADLRSRVYDYGRSGLLGLALDPAFPSLPYVYVLYTHDAPVGGTAPTWADACPAVNGDECAVSGRLSRLQASGNVITGAEQVLVEDWFQRHPGQPVGGLAFGPDGALYASAGDGASSAFVDVGQGLTPSPDPPDEGGALRSQDLRTPADPVALSGTVIRVHPDTGAPVRQTTSMLVGTPTVDANGVKSYAVTSVFQGPQPTIVRVLEPTSPAPGKPHRVLYVLPVEVGVTGLGSTYSDGLEELRLLNAHNQYNLTIVAPSFHIEPWYGDHDSNLDRRLESFIVRDLVPFGDSFAAPGVIPQRWVLGFSKSGNGALTLILRNPHVFSAGAAWDAPAQFTDMSAFPGMGQNFGTEANFDRYEIPTLVVTSAQAFQAQNRVWISGDTSAWTSHMIQLSPQMSLAGVLHTFVQGPARVHHWASGWLPGAVASLDANATAVAPVDSNAQRIVAYGLRNPTRITFRPGTDELWVADAGANAREEINLVPEASDGIVENFGWPCYEGTATTAYAGTGICSQLYAQPGAATPPFYAYDHAQPVVPGDPCAAGTGAVSGLAFYGTGAYPAAYQDALFFADASRGCIWAMRKGADGRPDPATRATIVPGASSPVDLRTGPAGDVFYADRDGGTVRRITYSTGNRAPTAVIQAGPLSGPSPLTVDFSAIGSTDPEGGALAYAWDLDGDGAFDDSTAAQPSFTYTGSGSRTVRLRVTDPQGLSDVAAVVVSLDNTPPIPTIAAPGAGLAWSVGQVVAFSGSATDAQDGPLPATSLSWSLILHHCPSDCHAHPLQDFVGVASGSFTTPDHEYPSHLELRLTVTDSGGLQASTSVLLQPQTATLSFQSSPSGLQLVVAGAPVTTPVSRTVIAGAAIAVSAVSPQTLGGTVYQFAAWSDGGAQTHTIVTATSQTYTATFTAADVTAPVLSGGLPSGELPAGTIQATLSLTTNENATCRYATTAGVAYAAMTGTFTTTGGTAHSTTVTGLVNGTGYSFFVRCQDPAGNANTTDFVIGFSVAAPAALPPGLVAAYGFNEGSGATTADASGNSHTGTISGAAWSTQGRFGNALSFDGVNDWVTAADSPLLDLTTGMTLEAWVFPTAHGNGTWRNVIMKERPGGEAYNLYSNVDLNVPQVWIDPNANTWLDARGTSQLPLNAWTHLAATFNGSTLILYVNGVQVGSRAVSGAILTSTGALRIGGNSVWGEFFQGRIDEIRVYNRALTPSEIQTDMATAIGGPTPDTTPPVRSSGLPTGTLAAGTTQTTLSLATNENATCRYATTAGVAYASMTSTFTTTGGTSHSTTVTGLVNGGSYSFFVRCQDPAGNPNTTDFTIGFSVAQPADTTPPVRSSGLPTGTLAAGTTQTTLSLATDENATCRYATAAGVAYASMTSTFTTTGGTSHSTTVTGLVNGGSYSFFVRCQDPAGNPNTTDFTIGFSVASGADVGLVAAYGFNEGAGGTVADSSGNGLTGTISGATWTTAGRSGNALVFDGVNDWVTVADHASLDLTTGMTLAAWVFPTAHGNGVWRNVIIKERTGGEAYNLYSNVDLNVPQVWIDPNANTWLDARGTSQLPLNAWTHLAATFNGSTLILYVNGVQVGSRAVSGAILTSTGALRIGGNSVWGEFFQGRIDEIRIYNRALTQPEIQTDMTRPITP